MLYCEKVMKNFFNITFLIFCVQCSHLGETTTSLTNIDTELAGVFSSPPPMMKDLVFQNILNQREIACRRNRRPCLDITLLAQSLCQPVDYAHWDWLEMAWSSVYSQIQDEKDGANIFAQIKACSASPHAGQLMASLELLKHVHKKKFPILEEEILLWTKNRWQTHPEHIETILIEVAKVINELLLLEPKPEAAIISLSLMSVNWVNKKNLELIATEALMQWSMSLAEVLPSKGHGRLFHNLFSDIIPRTLKDGQLLWAVSMARKLCQIENRHKKIKNICEKSLKLIRKDSFARPEIQLDIDYILFHKYLSRNKSIENIASQMQNFLMRARKWDTNLIPYIYLDAADLFLQHGKISQAESQIESLVKEQTRESLSSEQLTQMNSLKNQIDKMKKSDR